MQIVHLTKKMRNKNPLIRTGGCGVDACLLSEKYFWFYSSKTIYFLYGQLFSAIFAVKQSFRCDSNLSFALFLFLLLLLSCFYFYSCSYFYSYSYASSCFLFVFFFFVFLLIYKIIILNQNQEQN